MVDFDFLGYAAVKKIQLFLYMVEESLVVLELIRESVKDQGTSKLPSCSLFHPLPAILCHSYVG